MMPFEIGGGDRGSINGLRIAKGIVFEFVNAMVQTVHHLTQSVPESCVFINKNLFVLVLEQILDSGDVDFLGIFILVFDLIDI